MNTFRTFIKKASLFFGITMYSAGLPASIQRAFEIEANTGTTYLDAKHIALLIQKNRSFDYCFGMLKGIIRFNTQRAMNLPNGFYVGLQT